MTTDYVPDNPIPTDELLPLGAEALSGREIKGIERIGRGSTNLVYRIKTSDGDFILKIAHRADRIKAGILEKEVYILKMMGQYSWPVSVPILIWFGRTKHDFPAFIENAFPGDALEKIVNQDTNVKEAGYKLGQFVGQLHGLTHDSIDEFETNRRPFPDFSSYARYWMEEWRPLCESAPHIALADIKKAYQRIEVGLKYFQNDRPVYVNADLGKENLIGVVENNKLELSGVCDFENTQTGPPEYDIATLENYLFLDYPAFEKPFFEGYQSIRALPANFEERFVVVNLFRGLRYIKRVVKYDEKHFYDVNRRFLGKWLNK